MSYYPQSVAVPGGGIRGKCPRSSRLCPDSGPGSLVVFGSGFLVVFIFTKLIPINHRRRKWARWPFGPPGPKSPGLAQSIQGPLRSRHASRCEFMQGFMCISACGRVAGLAGRFIDLHGFRTLGMCRVAGWIRRLCN